MQSSSSGEPSLANQDLYTEKAFAILQNLPSVADRFSQQFLEVELLLYAALQVTLLSKRNYVTCLKLTL